MTRKLEPGLWLLCGLILVTLLRYGVEAFALHTWAIPDDARQFLTWTSRIADPMAMPDDLLADYWQQTAPPLYRALLYIAAAAGLAPVLLAKLLAFPLIALAAALAWQLSGCFSQGRPTTRLIATLCVMAAIVHNDSIFSGTPRAFASPLILLTLLGMAKRSAGLPLGGLLLLSLVYPAPAITCLGIFVLHRLHWRFPLRLDLSWPSVLLVGGAAALVLGLGVFFKAGLGDWGPTLSLAEAKQSFSLATPGGRSSIVGPDGNIAWICSPRIGFLPAIVNCHGNWDPRWLIDLMLSIVPMIAVHFLAGRRSGYDAEPAWRLFPYALLSASICYLAAALLAFAFHLPARYSQPVLLIMGSLALGLCLGAGWERLSAAPRRIALGILVVAGMVAFATPKMRLAHPENDDLVSFIAATPPGTRIAGIAPDLDMAPALTGRSILASPEHDIPYHRRYHRANQAGLRASLAMSRLDSLTEVVQAVRRNRIDLLVFERHFLETGRLPDSYRSVLPPPYPSKAAIGGLAALRSAPCRVVQGRQWVAIFTACLR